MSHEPDLIPSCPGASAITLWGDKEALVKQFLAAFLLLLAPALSAQQPVPEIPFDGDVNFLKLPADLHLGEVSGVAVNSKRHIFIYMRGNSAAGPAYAATASVLLEFDADGKFIREIGKGLYAWSYAHVVRVDKDDNIWAIDKGSDMIVKFNPEGRVVDGLRPQEGSVRRGRAVDARQPAAAARRRPVPPADRRRLGHAGQHLHQRRLHQLTRRQVHQGRRLGEVVGRARHRAGRSSNTPHSIANDAKGNIYVADRGNRRIQVFDPDGNLQREIKIDVPIPPDAKPWFGNQPTARTAPPRRTARRGRSASRRDRRSISTRPTRSRAASTS